MRSKPFVVVFALLCAINAFPQKNQQQTGEPETTIRISTQLIQLDAVVTDKAGKIVKGLSKNDFELFENGKRQDISFFEFVDAERASRPNPSGKLSPEQQQAAIQGAGIADIHRIFAFVIDDLTMQPADLVFVREMLSNFVNNRMQPTDLVAIVRVVGGNALLQQFTTDKELLRRAISKLTPKTSPFNAFTQYEDPAKSVSVAAPTSIGSGPTFNAIPTLSGDAEDLNSETDDANATLRAYMTLGTAGFLIDGMKELPGRKAMVLVSGGLPALGGTTGGVVGDVSYFLDRLSDQATRAGVAINTLDIRGLSAQTGVASFDTTPARSAMGPNQSPGFGRVPDATLDGTKIPFDVIDAHMGLRQLSNATGGISELNRNDFNKGLDEIVETNEGYYLLAYTPADPKFNGEFRKIDIKVKGYKVLTRRGYVAREEHPPAPPATKKEELLKAIKSPLAKRDIGIDAALFYTAMPDNKGAVGIGMGIDPSKLKFQAVGDKQEANFDVAGFVFDELGKMRGGFDDTVKADLTAEELKHDVEVGIPYKASTELPPGIYQIRLAVRDDSTSAIGTTTRYIEVPDLARGHFSASSLLIGAVPPGESKAGIPQVEANRAFSRKQDLRYALIVYNPKTKDGAPAVTGQVIISKNGKEMYREPPKPLAVVGGKGTEVVKIGQVGLSHVSAGRYTLTVIATDTLADKKTAPKIRSVDFTVVD
ncbi:MAG TPA: VWA domain-containing protein [Blastocatellia bacterium]|nr:VWA domain-containing protein [Blastocatellia bacterium]